MAVSLALLLLAGFTPVIDRVCWHWACTVCGLPTMELKSQGFQRPNPSILHPSNATTHHPPSLASPPPHHHQEMAQGRKKGLCSGRALWRCGKKNNRKRKNK